MESFFTELHSLITQLKPTLENWVLHYGNWIYAILFVIVFCETGLVVTPFLPGDSLLFVAGAIAALGKMDITLLLMLLIIAAVLGDAVNYSIGYYIGPRLFRSETAWLLNRKHLEKTQAFYEKYGGKTIILARFVPIIRTFAPFVAGMGKMKYANFAFYNVLGAVLWVVSMTMLGWLLGKSEFVEKRLEIIVLGIIVLSVLPMVYEIYMERRKHLAAKKESEAKSEATGAI
jgi:membrane-associated protein